MGELIQYAGALTLGTLSVPLALGLSWIALRCIFDLMPAANRAPARSAASAPPKQDWHALFGGHGAHLPARR